MDGAIHLKLQDGMGQLKIVPGGLQLSGQALFLDVLRASSIRSRHGQPITIGMHNNGTRMAFVL